MKDFVTYELAVKLKDKGFPQRTFGKYDMQGACYIEDGRFYENGCITEISIAYTAPTISQVLKWLREEKKIALNIEFIPYVWQYKILDMSFENRFEPCGLTLFSNYEEAAITGIEYALDNLI